MRPLRLGHRRAAPALAGCGPAVPAAARCRADGRPGERLPQPPGPGRTFQGRSLSRCGPQTWPGSRVSIRPFWPTQPLARPSRLSFLCLHRESALATYQELASVKPSWPSREGSGKTNLSYTTGSSRLPSQLRLAVPRSPSGRGTGRRLAMRVHFNSL